MNSDDRAQFLEKISSLDLEIGDALAGNDLPELVALAGRAALVAATAMLYQQPTPPAPLTCVLCQERPGTVAVADWDLCEGCWNVISAPWQGMDENWGELAEVDAELVY